MDTGWHGVSKRSRSSTTQRVYLLPGPTLRYVRTVWPWQGHRGHHNARSVGPRTSVDV